jgi:hypothetical protein
MITWPNPLYLHGSSYKSRVENKWSPNHISSMKNSLGDKLGSCVCIIQLACAYMLILLFWFPSLILPILAEAQVKEIKSVFSMLLWCLKWELSCFILRGDCHFLCSTNMEVNTCLSLCFNKTIWLGYILQLQLFYIVFSPCTC